MSGLFNNEVISSLKKSIIKNNNSENKKVEINETIRNTNDQNIGVDIITYVNYYFRSKLYYVIESDFTQWIFR